LNEVARSVVFSLFQKGLIDIDTTSAQYTIRRSNNQNDFKNLNPIEQLTLGWLGTEREPRELFGAYGLVQQLDGYGKTYQTLLEQQQMLTGEEDRAALKPVKWTVYLLILGLGSYKLLAALAFESYNVIFLIGFTIVGLLIARRVARLPRVTKLGRAYLERLQTVFESLKYTSQAAYIPSNQAKPAPQPALAGVDPLLLSVGVFGSAILAGTVFEAYNQAFHRAQAAGSTSGGGSCGSGCGSCSSGGSTCSSSDGGGSSCGGGCGGCGGGGD
jgi:uncharacterized protein (TIGR04222 family)